MASQGNSLKDSEVKGGTEFRFQAGYSDNKCTISQTQTKFYSKWKKVNMEMGYTGSQVWAISSKLTAFSWEPPMETGEKPSFRVRPNHSSCRA